MTLHLTQITENYSLHVSDRLVSGGIRDPLANKCLVYWARGAVVSMGYTGLAYGLSPIDKNMPTDDWIAEKLLGKPIPKDRDGIRSVAFGIEKLSKWLDIGQSINLLKTELQNSFDCLHPKIRNVAFELIITGFQASRRRGIKPIVVKIIKPLGNIPFSIERPERDWLLGGKFSIVTTPYGYISQDELNELGKNLEAASIDDAENVLAAKIRSTSFKFPKHIGSHCMSVFIPVGSDLPIRIRFIPNTVHAAIISSSTMKRVSPVAFSPWIIGPTGFMSPSVIIGGTNIDMGQLVIELDAQNSENGIVGLISAQHRPPGP